MYNISSIGMKGSDLYLAHENLADIQPVIIPYKAINRVFNTLYEYMEYSQGQCPASFCERGVDGYVTKRGRFDNTCSLKRLIFVIYHNKSSPTTTS